MSTYIGAFHTYGLLLTEKLAALLLENAKNDFSFNEYLVEIKGVIIG